MSPEMLNIAREKIENSGYEPHLVCQTLQDIDLYGAYHIAFCSLDTVNHILYKRDLKTFFKKLYNFIEPGGFFVFDVKTSAAFKKTVGMQTFEHDDGSVAMINGSFSSDIAYYAISVFEARSDGLFEKYESEIEERFYSVDSLKSMLVSSGFCVEKRYNIGDRQVWITARSEKTGIKKNG